MRPSSHALPAAPPPASTRARSLAVVASGVPSACGLVVGVVFMGVAFRELPVGAPSRDYAQLASSRTAGEHPVRILRTWVSPPADGSRSSER